MRRIVNRLKGYIDYVLIFTDWYKVVFPLNKFFRGPQCMNLRNGTQVHIRDSRSKDLSAIREVLGHNDYHLEKIALPPSPRIVDIGANIGTFSMTAHHSYPDAHIYAFEPHPDNFELLKKNAPFLTARQAAITATTGTVEFEAHGSPIGLRVKKGGGLYVDSLSLDDALASLPHIQILKLDVEGSEFDILGSTSNMTFNKIQKIFVEVHPTEQYPSLQEGKNWIEHALTLHGFKTMWMKKAVIFGLKD